MKKLFLVLFVLISACSLFAISDERLSEIATELNVPVSAIENLVSIYNPEEQTNDSNVVRVSFNEYMFDYRSNMVEADKKNKGKELEIYNCYGERLNQVIFSTTCDYYITCSDWNYNFVNFYINRADNAIINEALDNYFTVRGRQSEFGSNTLDNCRIIQIGYISENQ